MYNGNEPAYPWDDKHADGRHYAGYSGLTKRELFAAMAMQGTLASRLRDDVTSEIVASWSVQVADHLLAELAKGQGK